MQQSSATPSDTRVCVSPDNELQIYWGHDLDLSGSRDVISLWPFESQWAISYRRSIVTKSLSPAVLEILGVWALSIWGSRPNWLQANCPDFFTKDQWPPNSPDLNPVEYRVWVQCWRLTASLKQSWSLKTIAGPRFRLSGANATWTDRQGCEKTSQSDWRLVLEMALDTSNIHCDSIILASDD